ncbi:MAG: RHS repeat-associated core domain-containing protein [Velocimicrobium sp.]
MVDRNGNIVNNYEYDEWGNVLYSKETVSNPFKYAGEVYDEETGLYYLSARYYDPKMGRFINEDTYEGQAENLLSLNSYIYCYNNPIRYRDPSGNIPVETVLDFAFILWDAGECAKNPSLQNFAYLTWDIVAAALPYVPGSYITKGGKVIIKADNAEDASKAADKFLDLLEDGKKAKNARGAKSAKMDLQFFAEKGTSKAAKGASNSIDNLIHGVKETTNGKGVARNFEKAGGYSKTVKDFNKLKPTNVKEIHTKYGTGYVGTLSDGTKVVARPGSTTGGATLEIKISNSKVYKIRY